MILDKYKVYAMASIEHKLLSQYIKDVHSSLRKSSLKVGVDKAWEDHCKNKETLVTYAQYMEQLATMHWENNYSFGKNGATSRIKWAAELCYDYFINKSYMHYRKKESNICKKILIELDTEECFSVPLKLIDVGSCYNPFKQYLYFDVTAVDLCPANNSVLQCDFLKVSIGSHNIIHNSEVQQLKHSFYDVVTFCFLLEYIPSSDLRISACEKAYIILKPGGLFIISTPDSKHVGANSKIMKCWRYTLANIGFIRIKYEKYKHMHCMAFRKALQKETAMRWAQIHKELYMEHAIHIPQDFQGYSEENSCHTYGKTDTTYDFEELPFYNILSDF